MPKFQWISIRTHHSLCLLASVFNIFPCEFLFVIYDETLVVVLSTANFPIYRSKNIPPLVILIDCYSLIPIELFQFYTFSLIMFGFVESVRFTSLFSLHCHSCSVYVHVVVLEQVILTSQTMTITDLQY